MRKIFLVVLALFAVSIPAFAERRHAVERPQRVEVQTPFVIGLSYGPQDQWILTGKPSGLYMQQVLPYALGNSLPANYLDLSRGFAELTVDGNGIRFYSKTHPVYPGYIVPFDPVNPYATDMFVKGTEVSGLVTDCPIWGIPNDDVLHTITAMSHFPHYVLIDPPIFHAMSASAADSILGIQLDTSDGFRLVLMDHYTDAAGEWYVAEAQCLHDATGKLVTYNYERSGCYLIQ